MQEKNAVSIESNELRGYLSMGSESGLEGVYEPKEGYAYGLNWEQEEDRQRYKTNDMQVDNIWPRALLIKDREKLDELFQLTTKLATLMSDLLERLLVEKYHNGVEKSIIKGENV